MAVEPGWWLVGVGLTATCNEPPDEKMAWTWLPPDQLSLFAEFAPRPFNQGDSAWLRIYTGELLYRTTYLWHHELKPCDRDDCMGLPTNWRVSPENVSDGFAVCPRCMP